MSVNNHGVPEFEKVVLNEDDMVIEQNTNLKEGSHIEKYEDMEVYTPPITDKDLEELGNIAEIRYKTKDVAERLGISAQMVRNYCDVFDEYIGLEKTPSGHRLFTQENISRLENIIKIKNERGLTIEQTFEFLVNERDPDIALKPEKRFEFMLQMLEKSINDTVTAAINKNLLLLESQNNDMQQKYIEEMQKMEGRLTEKDHMIQKLIEENKALAQNIEQLKDSTIQIIKETSSENTEVLVQELRGVLDEKKERKKWKFW